MAKTKVKQSPAQLKDGIGGLTMTENNAREIEEGLYRRIKYFTQELEARKRVDEKCRGTVSEKLKPLNGGTGGRRMTIEECKAFLPQGMKYPLPVGVIDTLLDLHAIFIKCGLNRDNMNYALLAALIELRERREQEG